MECVPSGFAKGFLLNSIIDVSIGSEYRPPSSDQEQQATSDTDMDLQNRSKVGVALIMPRLERGMDPYGSSQLTYAMHIEHIVRAGYAPRLIDPRDASALTEVLVSKEFPILLTNRSQSKDWTKHLSDNDHIDAARRKILISLQGNPPFYPGSKGFHESIFDRKLSLFIDHGSIEYARACNTSNAIIGFLKPACHNLDLQDEASWRKASSRQIPILFVGTYEDPVEYRAAWRQAFKDFPRFVSCIEDAAELLTSDLGMSVVDALSKATGPLQSEYNLFSRAGQLALELLARFANNYVRRRMLQAVVRYPATIISTDMPPIDRKHPGCSIGKTMEFRALLDLMKHACCIVSSNPNHMTGALTERVSNGMRRGAVILNPPNSALSPYMGRAVGNIGPQMEKLEEWLDAAASGDERFDAMGASAIEIARSKFDRTAVYKEFLDTACDPETWTG